MYFYDRTVQAKGLDLDADDLFLLQLGENTIQNPGLGPSIHACVDCMPVSEAFRQAPPLAAVLSYVQYRVNYLKIGDAHITPLARQTGLYTNELCFVDFH